MLASEDICEDSCWNFAEEYGGEETCVDEVDLEEVETMLHEETHVDGAMNRDPSCIEEAGENVILSDDACVHMCYFLYVVFNEQKCPYWAKGYEKSRLSPSRDFST